MIRTTVVAKVKPEKRKEFLQAISSLQRDREGENPKGALRLYQDEEDMTCFCLIDECEASGDLESYCQGQGFRVLIGALQTLCAEVEVKYGLLNGKGGEWANIISQDKTASYQVLDNF
ncbi:MAG: hypothetical protein A4E65_02360 [Syntrophorhabdus sp. PtaU1.Bin153]|nr:MAG: hypothetical protein A4E65_02360 [Syntrophorhabdus sp. PtaU1.Bin153]